MQTRVQRHPNCLKCVHFKVTWDAAFPRGCTLFGVKSRKLPSIVVHESTGKRCPAFVKSVRIKESHE